MVDELLCKDLSHHEHIYRKYKPFVALDNRIPRDIHLDFPRMIQSAKRHFAAMDILSSKIESALSLAEKNAFKEHKSKIKKLQKE